MRVDTFNIFGLTLTQVTAFACQHQTIAWTIIDLSSVRSSDNHQWQFDIATKSNLIWTVTVNSRVMTGE